MDFIDHRSTANFKFSLSATDEKLRIKSDGNVGIGVSNPSTKLEVDGVITTAGLTTTANINFGDNDKAIFGAGSDLQIYHDGSDSYIRDIGTGNLNILADELKIMNASGTENKAFFVSDGGAYLYHNNSSKLETTSTGIDVTGDTDTSGLFRFGVNNSEIANNYVRFKPTGAAYIDHSTVGQVINFRLSASSSLDTTPLVVNSTGIDVTGTVTADGLTVDGASDLNGNVTVGSSITTLLTGNDIEFQRAGDSYLSQTGGGALNIRTNDGASNKVRMNLANNGDISFYNSAGTSQSLFWDASAESLGIGTSSLIAKMHVKGAGTSSSTNAIFAENSSGAGLFAIRDNGDAFILGNTGIGTSSPSSAAGFDAKLQLESANPMLVYKETDQSTKWEVGAWGGNYVVYNGSTERLRINSSGNVGIGRVSNSAVRLSVAGSDAGSSNYAFEATNSSAATRFIVRNDGQSQFFKSDNSASMTITNAGNVGIGTSSPAENLHISSSSGSARIRMTSADGSDNMIVFGDASDSATGAIKFDHSDNSLAFYGFNNTERMRINSSGNVGIGQSSPTSPLHVKSGANNNNSIITIEGATNNIFELGYATAGAFLNSAAGDPMVFRINETERMRIDSAGRLGLGTTSPTYLLNVVAPSGSQAIFQAGQSGISNGYTINSNGTNLTHQWYNDGSEAVRIDSSGNLQLGNTTGSRRLNVFSDTDRYTVDLRNESGYNSGELSGIVFSGRYDSSNNVTDMASIGGGKENTTDGNFGGRLSFFTRSHNGSDTERMRIDSSGNLNLVSSSSGLIDFNFTDASLNNYARIQGGKSGSGGR